MSERAAALVGDIDALLSLPQVYIRIRDLLQDPQSDFRDFADVVSADPDSDTGEILYFLQDPALPGTFLPPGVESFIDPLWIIGALDLNGDGLVDLVVPNRRDDDTAVLAGDGAGGFQLAGKLPSAAEPVRVGLSDLDFDGDVDVLVASSAGAALRVYLNQLVP